MRVPHRRRTEIFETSFYRRHLLPVGEAFRGPAIVLQKDSTTVIPPGWSAINDPAGNLILTTRELDRCKRPGSR